MQDKLYYYNRYGILQVCLNDYPYFMTPDDLKNWSWGYDVQFGQIQNFRRNKENYVLTVGVAEDFKAARDALTDIFSADVIAGEPGYLLYRGWRLDCFITEASYSYALYMDRQVAYNIRAVDSVWKRFNTIHINNTNPDLSSIDLGRDYEKKSGVIGRGYRYGYSRVAVGSVTLSLSGTGNGYKILFYGAVTNPSMYINDDLIQVNIDVDGGQYLEIISDGNDKQINLVELDGTKTPAFAYRDKDYSPFVEIGDSVMVTYGEIEFDFTTIERRSEPTWI